MFDSMNMHMPVVVVVFALILIVVAAGLFVAVRVAGQRIFDDEASEPTSPPDHHS
ncbi:MAG: hypothetical protein H0V07_15530 [Propionibacteriales bacterium]|nr:hypothetical protein [Propionibacteriales bacterium]